VVAGKKPTDAYVRRGREWGSTELRKERSSSKIKKHNEDAAEKVLEKVEKTPERSTLLSKQQTREKESSWEPLRNVGCLSKREGRKRASYRPLLQF